MFIINRTKHASKGGIELAILKSIRGFLIEVLSFGLGVGKLVLVRLLAILLVDGLSFVHTAVYDAYKRTHNQEKKYRLYR